MNVSKARKTIKNMQEETSKILRKMSANAVMVYNTPEAKDESIRKSWNVSLEAYNELKNLNAQISVLKAKLTKANEEKITVVDIGVMSVNEAIFRLKQITSVIYTVNSFSQPRDNQRINQLGQVEVTENAYDVAFFEQEYKNLIEDKENLQEAIDRFNLTFEV